MKIGDLVRYKDPAGRWAEWIGIVVRCIAGTDKRKVVAWAMPSHYKGRLKNRNICYPERQLEVISEGR
jgi:hypothetical protein